MSYIQDVIQGYINIGPEQGGSSGWRGKLARDQPNEDVSE
jgi:hypothetical protein